MVKKIFVANKNTKSVTGAKRILELEKRIKEMSVTPKKKKKVVQKQVVVASAPSLASKLANTLRGLGSGIEGFSKIWGYGDYSMSQNSCFDSTSQQVPFMHSSKSTFRLKNREYLFDLTGTTSGFAPFRLGINPTNSTLFPYLANIAGNFQEYRWMGLAFEYKTTCATAVANSTNPSMGKVVMSIQYDVDQANPADQRTMLNTMWAVDGVVYKDILIPVECAPDLNPTGIYFMNQSNVASLPSDARFSFIGNLILAALNNPSTNAVGEIWVTYDIELSKPSPSLSPASKAFQAQSTTGITASASFGSSRVVNYDSIGMSVSATTIGFPTGWTGVARINYWVAGGAVTAGQPAFTYTNGLSVVQCSGNNYLSTGNGDTVVSLLLTWDVTCTACPPGTQPAVALSGGTYPSTASAMNLQVMILPGSVTST